MYQIINHNGNYINFYYNNSKYSLNKPYKLGEFLNHYGVAPFFKLDEIEMLLKNTNCIYVYNGKTFIKPTIRFAFNKNNKKLYFQMTEPDTRKYILCSNRLKNIIEDNLNTQKKNMYELSETYINQFHIFPTENFNDKNNSFYTCYYIYKTIFDNLDYLQKLYTGPESTRMSDICKFIDEKTKIFDTSDEQQLNLFGNNIQNIISFRDDINKFIHSK